MSGVLRYVVVLCFDFCMSFKKNVLQFMTVGMSFIFDSDGLFYITIFIIVLCQPI